MPIVLQRVVGAMLIALSGIVLASDTPVDAHEPVPILLLIGGAPVELSIPERVATVGEALTTYGITTDRMFVNPPRTTPLAPNLVITLLPTRTFVLKDGERGAVSIETIGLTVGDALALESVTLGPLDVLEPSLSASLADGMTVTITRITERETAETVPVPHPTVYTDDPELLWANEALTSAGEDGRAEEDVRMRYVNGELVKRTVLVRRVLTEPVTEERKRGTKIVVEEISEGGASWYAYKQCDCAAHNRYPRGTWLRVTSLLNGSRVMVKVNDWGPDPSVHPDRAVDLDAVAFRKLAPLGKGVIPVRVEKIQTE